MLAGKMASLNWRWKGGWNLNLDTTEIRKHILSGTEIVTALTGLANSLKCDMQDPFKV